MQKKVDMNVLGGHDATQLGDMAQLRDQLAAHGHHHVGNNSASDDNDKLVTSCFAGSSFGRKSLADMMAEKPPQKRKASASVGPGDAGAADDDIGSVDEDEEDESSERGGGGLAGGQPSAAADPNGGGGGGGGSIGGGQHPSPQKKFKWFDKATTVAKSQRDFDEAYTKLQEKVVEQLADSQRQLDSSRNKPDRADFAGEMKIVCARMDAMRIIKDGTANDFTEHCKSLKDMASASAPADDNASQASSDTNKTIFNK